MAAENLHNNGSGQSYSITSSAPGEQRRRESEAEHLRSFEVEDQFDFHRLHHRQVGGFRTI
ncbi:hypothetical protein [Bradyrhizobium sp. WSM2254]|uniref:hypothetical protein n=1 Tax=Bradyrhizobium sp. WSM2254 TaxID=1188263 RepID=UPI0003F4DE7F|nr:hypothetical protein [Bradyrhizobium sp. WSM2254]